MKVYLVGGAVRDKLLGWPTQEKDWVVVGATTTEMIEKGYKEVGRDFPVFLHPQTHEEYALARTERKSGRGYRGFEVHASPDVTLKEDLMRRDLTINAMAMDDTGALIDPWGGKKDLEQRLFRHVSPAFAEDPLRILRVARFAARYADFGFVVAPSTLEFMKAMVANKEVDFLVPERIWAEFEKALLEARPRKFIEVLRQCGALARIMPEVDALFGVPQPVQHHPEIDTGEHSLMVLDWISARNTQAATRFAALVHDLGKGTTPQSLWPKHHGHEQRGVKLIRTLCQRLKCPQNFLDLALLTAKFHTHIHRATEQRPETLLNVFKMCDAFRRPERFEQLVQVCEADHYGRGDVTTDYPQADFFRRCLAVVASVSIADQVEAGVEGSKLGKILDQRRLAAISNECHR